MATYQKGQKLYSRVRGELLEMTVVAGADGLEFELLGERYSSPTAAGRAYNASIGKKGWAVFKEEKPEASSGSRGGGRKALSDEEKRQKREERRQRDLDAFEAQGGMRSSSQGRRAASAEQRDPWVCVDCGRNVKTDDHAHEFAPAQVEHTDMKPGTVCCSCLTKRGYVCTLEARQKAAPAKEAKAKRGWKK